MLNYKNPCIFVVEDDAAYRKLIEKTLKAKNYKNIHTFSSGEECINYLEKLTPDIVIQDYDLEGGMNGLETMKQLKAIHPDCEYVFLSGQSSIEVAVETIKEGAFDYVIKDNVAQQNLVHKIKKIILINKLIVDRENSRLAVKIISSGFLLLLVIIISYWHFIIKS